MSVFDLGRALLEQRDAALAEVTRLRASLETIQGLLLSLNPLIREGHPHHQEAWRAARAEVTAALAPTREVS